MERRGGNMTDAQINQKAQSLINGDAIIKIEGRWAPKTAPGMAINALRGYQVE